MSSTSTTASAAHTIADVARASGLSADTLRWYGREGLIPPVPRDSAGRRVYDDPTLRMILLLVRLRRTGMPVARMRDFVAMVAEGAASHGRRMQLLTDHRVHVLEQLLRLREDLAALDQKIDHYDRLIDAGLDCAERPVEDLTILRAQRSTS